MAASTRFVLGFDIARIDEGKVARWKQYEHDLFHFLISDAEFIAFKRARHYAVTESSLRGFPLDGIYQLIGATGLKGQVTLHQREILPLLDQKIRRKLAQVYNALSVAQQRQEGYTDAEREKLTINDGGPPPAGQANVEPIVASNRAHNDLRRLRECLHERILVSRRMLWWIRMRQHVELQQWPSRQGLLQFLHDTRAMVSARVDDNQRKLQGPGDREM